MSIRHCHRLALHFLVWAACFCSRVTEKTTKIFFELFRDLQWLNFPANCMLLVPASACPMDLPTSFCRFRWVWATKEGALSPPTFSSPPPSCHIHLSANYKSRYGKQHEQQTAGEVTEKPHPIIPCAAQRMERPRQPLAKKGKIGCWRSCQQRIILLRKRSVALHIYMECACRRRWYHQYLFQPEHKPVLVFLHQSWARGGRSLAWNL